MLKASSPDRAKNLATDIPLARLFARHYTRRGANNRRAQSTQHTGNLINLAILAKATFALTLQPTDNWLKAGSVLQVESQCLLYFAFDGKIKKEALTL
jgi:hypothetical protein